VYAISAAVMLSIMAFLCLPRQLAMSNFYMFMASVLYINIGGAQDFWFTADEKCVPGGPVSACVPWACERGHGRRRRRGEGGWRRLPCCLRCKHARRKGRPLAVGGRRCGYARTAAC